MGRKRHRTPPRDAARLLFQTRSLSERSAPRSAQLRTHLSRRSGAARPSARWKRATSHLFPHTRARFSATPAASPLMKTDGESDGVFADAEQHFFLFGVSGGADDWFFIYWCLFILRRHFWSSKRRLREALKLRAARAQCLILTTMSQTICAENLKACCTSRGAYVRARWSRWTQAQRHTGWVWQLQLITSQVGSDASCEAEWCVWRLKHENNQILTEVLYEGQTSSKYAFGSPIGAVKWLQRVTVSFMSS